MANIHNWPKYKAAKVGIITNQRKHNSKNPHLNARVRTQCPKQGCFSNVLSLRDHYRNKHPEMIPRKVDQFFGCQNPSSSPSTSDVPALVVPVSKSVEIQPEPGESSQDEIL